MKNDFFYASQVYRRKSRASVSFFFQSIELLIHKSYIFMYIFVNWKIFDYVYIRSQWYRLNRTHSTDILVVAQWLTNCVCGIENTSKGHQRIWRFAFLAKVFLNIFYCFPSVLFVFCYDCIFVFASAGGWFRLFTKCINPIGVAQHKLNGLKKKI